MGNTLDVVNIKCSLGTQKMSDFLAIPPDTLTAAERDIQEALAFIYRKNEEKGLFGKFPDWHKKPLMIDCEHIACEESNVCGDYSPITNEIKLKKSTENVDLINILSHELKHAEQATKEISRLTSGKDNLLKHQIGFLQEAQAYPFGMYVSLLKAQEDYTTNPQKAEERFDRLDTEAFQQVMDIFGNVSNFNYAQSEEQLIMATLPIVCNDALYKGEYDDKHPLGINDKGLSQIPESFPLKQKPSFLLTEKLLETPRKPHRHIAAWLVHNQRWDEALQKMSEQDHTGRYISSEIERCRIFQSFTETGNHVDFSKVAQLLASKDKTGVSLVPESEKESYLQKLFEEQNKENILDKVFRRDSITKRLHLLKKEPNLFSQKAINLLLNFKSDDVSSKNLKRIDSEQEKKLTFLSQVTQVPEKSLEWIMDDAIKYGFVKTANTALNKIGVSHSNLMNVLKGQSYTHIGENISATQRNNKIKIINSILNLKDKSGNPIISEQDVQMLLYRAKKYQSETVSPLEEAFNIYQKRNPSDQRFISSDAMRLQVIQTLRQEATEFRKKHLPEKMVTTPLNDPKSTQLKSAEKSASNQINMGISHALVKTQNPTSANRASPSPLILPNHTPQSSR